MKTFVEAAQIMETGTDLVSPHLIWLLRNAIVEHAGAVDGVTVRREATVDGFGPDIHGPLVDELGRIAWGQGAD